MLAMTWARITGQARRQISRSVWARLPGSAAVGDAAERLATTVIDRAIQVFGGAGVSDDWPLADMYAHARTLHFVDGPDEVHLMQIARRELRAYEDFRG